MDNGGSKTVILMFGGGMGGAIGYVNILFTGSHTYIDLIVKFFGLLIAAFITGFVTVLGNDFYKLKVKNKLFKIKEDERTDKERVA